MLSLIKNALNIIYPPCCLICSEAVTKANSFCAECWADITFISAPYCIKCAVPLSVDHHGNICYLCKKTRPLFDGARAVFRYDNNTKSLIHALKFNDKTQAANAFAELMFIYGKELIRNVDLIIPVPITRSKLAKRKYNQAVLLAKPIARESGKLLRLNILAKLLETGSQVGLRKADRQRNLEKAFVCKDVKLIRGKKILLVDDVLTTGATANACSKVLKKNGAARVFVLTLARTY